MAIQIPMQVIAGEDMVNEVRNRETRELIALKQTVYVDVGQAFPIRAQIRVKERLNPGKYMMQPVLQTGKFGDLEINPFQEPLVTPATPQQVKSA